MKIKLNSKGFTLLEIIISMGLLSITICPLLSMIILAAKINKISDIEYKTMQLAQAHMEEIAVMKSIDGEKYTYNDKTKNYERVVYEYDDYKTEIKIKRTGEENLYSVEVIVKKDGQEINELKGTKLFY